MDTDPTDPGLSVDPTASRCPHCGGGCGVGDVTALNCAMLAEMSGIGMMMLRVMARKVAATDDVKPADAMSFETVSRSVRRTAAILERISADAKKTPEQRAAEDIRRAEAAERARFRVRKPPAPLEGDAIIKREPGPSDRENLLSDMNERLLPRGFDAALTQPDLSAIVLGILKQFGIVPKNETWSPEMMAAEVSGACGAEAPRGGAGASTAGAGGDDAGAGRVSQGRAFHLRTEWRGGGGRPAGPAAIGLA